jgi:DNA mismatch repair protein MutS2
MRWKSARHPLLLLSHRIKGKPVIPLDLELTDDNRILVITGPNAGGKSVCLKTTGLLQYMLQCGLLVPMDADSASGIFENLFIDIGDEQSLENDLSTYSSHLLNLRYFIENCNESSLFLVDELGTGTDPSLGGALAEAVLEKLSETRAFGVVTTHYSNLKLLAGKIPGIFNGAMLFDTEALQPLYKLAIGKPGSSFTFEIAQRIGFPSDVISVAKSKTGKTHLDFEQQLQEVEAEKLQLEQQLKEFQVADSFLADLISKYEKIKAEVETSRISILEKAREEAREMLEKSNRLIERTIREIKESQADKEKTKDARDLITRFRNNIDKPSGTSNQSAPASQTKLQQKIWKKGDRVSVEGRSGIGIILQIKGDKATVDFDGFKISTITGRLQPAQESGQKIPKAYSSIISELNEKAVNFKLTLDLRGKSAEEALLMVQKYLDDAYLLRIKEVSILHGKGEGILRRVIRDYLAGQEEVESFTDESLERGGAGITKVNLR